MFFLKKNHKVIYFLIRVPYKILIDFFLFFLSELSLV